MVQTVTLVRPISEIRALIDGKPIRIWRHGEATRPVFNRPRMVKAVLERSGYHEGLEDYVICAVKVVGSDFDYLIGVQDSIVVYNPGEEKSPS